MNKSIKLLRAFQSIYEINQTKIKTITKENIRFNMEKLDNKKNHGVTLPINSLWNINWEEMYKLCTFFKPFLILDTLGHYTSLSCKEELGESIQKL